MRYYKEAKQLYDAALEEDKEARKNSETKKGKEKMKQTARSLGYAVELLSAATKLKNAKIKDAELALVASA